MERYPVYRILGFPIDRHNRFPLLGLIDFTVLTTTLRSSFNIITEIEVLEWVVILS
jgi:hypothetical protein